MAGKLPAQKRKKLANMTVLVPEAGMPLWMLSFTTALLAMLLSSGIQWSYRSPIVPNSSNHKINTVSFIPVSRPPMC